MQGDGYAGGKGKGRHTFGGGHPLVMGRESDGGALLGSLVGVAVVFVTVSVVVGVTVVVFVLILFGSLFFVLVLVLILDLVANYVDEGDTVEVGLGDGDVQILEAEAQNLAHVNGQIFSANDAQRRANGGKDQSLEADSVLKRNA